MKTQAYSLPVYRTEDYTIFKKLGGNRELYLTHVNRLVKLIDEDPEFTRKNPLKVNEQMEVIDGQHRLAAFQKFSENGGNPSLYYVIHDGLTLKDARAMNAGSKAWNPKDYATAFALEGNKEYQTYLNFLDEFKLNHHVLTHYLTGVSFKGNDFRIGEFKVKNEKLAKSLLTKLKEVGQYYPYWKLQHFGHSFYEIANSPKYDHKRMLEQISSFGDGFTNIPPRRRETLAAFNMVYNWNRKELVDLLS